MALPGVVCFVKDNSVTVVLTRLTPFCVAPANSDFLFKLLLIGDSGVGKSCLLLRFAVRLRDRFLLFAEVVCSFNFAGRHVHGELHQHDWR